MNVSARVTEALTHNSIYTLNKENIIHCIEFTRKMKSSGVLRSDLSSNSNTLDGGINQIKQLKLYACSPIIHNEFCLIAKN